MKSGTYNTIFVCPAKKEFSDMHQYDLHTTPVNVPHVGVIPMPDPDEDDRCTACGAVLLLIDVENNLRKNIVTSGVKFN